MPVKNGQGYSEWTPTKQRFFRRFIRLHLKIAASAMAKCYQRRYTYFDLNAGCGVDPDTNEDGSPLIFVDEAEKNGLEYQAYMVEINDASHEVLRSNLDAAKAYRAAAVHADHSEFVSDFYQRGYGKKFGLFYADPTGLDDLPLELLAKLSRYWTKADILMMVQGTSIKRGVKAHGHPRLLNRLETINKRRWAVREPADKYQFTFLYGTNGPLPVWAAEGFHDITTSKGQEILRKLNYTIEENQNGTNTLPLVF